MLLPRRRSRNAIEPLTVRRIRPVEDRPSRTQCRLWRARHRAYDLRPSVFHSNVGRSNVMHRTNIRIGCSSGSGHGKITGMARRRSWPTGSAALSSDRRPVDGALSSSPYPPVGHRPGQAGPCDRARGAGPSQDRRRHSVTLTETGRQRVRKPGARRPSPRVSDRDKVGRGIDAAVAQLEAGSSLQSLACWW